MWPVVGISLSRFAQLTQLANTNLGKTPMFECTKGFREKISRMQIDS